MERHISPLQKIASALIRSYQIVLSPVIGQQCRYIPTCSEYTRQAILMYGFWNGFYRGICRIGRCNPFCTSGFDPVSFPNDEL
ncbi:membrane protein insertion efficiency factor YidD [Succinimonas amylolytica]|uniref:membrane protein insertion efficiency factor YidD n=1 Tax=Succinimonas amylolytica TaxID=83769 RepID=UPI000A067E61|nr:membrane protein insertion efficiency factor YidD [Succinimonas amylolytica]